MPAAGEPNPVRWHAAVTNPGCEIAVRDAMARRGVDTVLPMLRFWQVRNRKRIIAERPLMARIVVFGSTPRRSTWPASTAWSASSGARRTAGGAGQG